MHHIYSPICCPLLIVQICYNDEQSRNSTQMHDSKHSFTRIHCNQHLWSTCMVCTMHSSLNRRWLGTHWLKKIFPLYSWKPSHIHGSNGTSPSGEPRSSSSSVTPVMHGEHQPPPWHGLCCSGSRWRLSLSPPGWSSLHYRYTSTRLLPSRTHGITRS